MALGSQYAFWPSDWMPTPQQDSWSFQPEDLRQTTETEVGAVIRPQFDSDILIADCTLVLNRMQSAWFEAFEKAVNHENLWFVFPVWYGGEIHDALCMFRDRPKWTVEAFTTTYKFSLLVQKRSLYLTPCALEMLDCWSPAETCRIVRELGQSLKTLNHSTDTGD